MKKCVLLQGLHTLFSEDSRITEEITLVFNRKREVKIIKTLNPLEK